MSNKTFTENKDIAFSSTNSKCLDFFSNVTRQNSSHLSSLLNACWKESPLDTLRLIFYKRDCRGGSGERKIFEVCYKWLIENHVETSITNCKYIPEFGYYKDLLNFLGTPLHKVVCNTFAEQITEDMSNLFNFYTNDDDLQVPKLSLASKWIPSPKSYYDKKFNVCNDISVLLGYTDRLQENYRKTINPLREQLTIVEKLMSNNKWDEIKFENVPSIAMKRLKNAFMKHQPERFNEWIKNVKTGKSKINSKLMPHEIIKGEIDDVSEIQWKTLVEDTKKLGKFNKCLVISDLSGSMGGKGSLAHDVSVALGILISECCEGIFKNKMITFSEDPTFFNLSGNTLKQKLNTIEINPSHGLSTDLMKVFHVLLQYSIQHQVKRNTMPEKIIIISDMQFDCADSSYGKSSYEMIKMLYEISDYKLPEVIFWNVKGQLNNFPATKDDIGVCMISGFSESILQVILSGEIVNPYSIMRKVIGSERYSCLQI